HLKLSAMSVRIPPKQSRFVFYEATADMAPAWFTIYSVFGMAHNGGANLQVELPHTVYLLQKQPLQKKNVAIESATYSQEEHQLNLRLVNRGPDLGRVQNCEVRGHKQKTDEPGFPLLPGNHRTVAIKWTGDTPPESVAIHFANFALEQDLRVQPR